tara:strand:+ start:12373 stop:12999 length:627 start_codon:yes stop_codon:yes gene_type:complete
MSTSENINNINDLFNGDVKDPFFYNLNIGPVENYSELFEKVKNIFLTGLMIHAGDIDKSNVNIELVTPDNIHKIAKYMLSIGLKLNYKKVDAEEKDFIYKGFLYEIEAIDDLHIEVTMNWKLNYVNNIKLTVNNNNENSLKKLLEVTKRHTEANFFLKIHPPQELKDFAIFVNKPDETHVISFEIANLADYKTGKCKPILPNGKNWQN